MTKADGVTAGEPSEQRCSTSTNPDALVHTHLLGFSLHVFATHVVNFSLSLLCTGLPGKSGITDIVWVGGGRGFLAK